MEDLATFVGLLLLVILFSSILGLASSFLKSKRLRLLGILLGLPSALLGVILVSQDVNFNTFIIGSTPIIIYIYVIIRYILWKRLVKGSESSDG